MEERFQDTSVDFRSWARDLWLRHQSSLSASSTSYRSGGSGWEVHRQQRDLEQYQTGFRGQPAAYLPGESSHEAQDGFCHFKRPKVSNI